MTSGRAWESPEEIELEKKQRVQKIEHAKKNPDYWRWLALRAKYEEFEEYIRLSNHWNNPDTVKPPVVNITAEMVIELRNITNMPTLKCQKTLKATNGDMDKAIDILRFSGIG